MKGKNFFACLFLSASLCVKPTVKGNNFFKTSLTTLLIFAALLLSVTNVQAQYSGTMGSLNYSFDNGVLTISGSGPMPNYDYTVSPWREYEWIDQIKTVVIGEGVTSVGAEAFIYCLNLTSVTLPESVTSIGMWAFSYCISLPSITLPEGLLTIGDGAFDHCSQLVSLNIPPNITNIGFGTFADCSKLASITLPEGVVTVGNFAFQRCSALATIRVLSAAPPAAGNLAFNLLDRASCKLIVPSGAKAAYQAAAYWQGFTNISEVEYSGTTGPLSWILTSDGTLVISGKGDMPVYTNYPNSPYSPWYAYRASIKTVVIEEGVTSIGDFAFADYFLPCYAALTQVSIPSSVTRIGRDAFSNCRALASVTIPAGVTSIGFYAFQNTAITSVTIPAGITRIENGVFSNCSNLASITFLGNITSIRATAFNNTGFTSFTIPGSVTSIEQYTFQNCIKLTSVTIPNSVTSIGVDAFRYCTALTTVTIGNGITYWGLEGNAFSNCTALTTVRIFTLTPPSLDYKDDVFYYINPACVLEVPSESKNLYMAVAGWKQFATINEIVDPDLASSVVSASIASSTSITINGTITNSSSEAKNSAGYYCAYGTDPNNLNQNTATQYGTVPASGSLNVSTTITGLTNGTLYYYKLVAVGNRSAPGKIFLSNPIPTSNLKLWLRADMAITSASSAVSAWGDVSGWNNDASQGTSGNQPTVAESAINAKPALAFNGSTSKLTLPTSTSLGLQSTPYEMFIVAKSSSSDIQFLIAGGANEQFEYHLNGVVGARFIPVTSLYLDKGTAGDYIDGNAHVFSGRASSGGGTIRVDGVDGFSSTGNLLSSNSGNLLLGVRSDGSYYFNGSIAEVIIYSANLSSADRNTVEQYLANRYGITSGALPVELTSFTASNTNGKVLLNWQTATEVNNYGFEIERCKKQEARSETWEKIGFVQGHGNSNSPKNYSFTDSNPPSGKVQYRLKQIDYDGQFEYSEIIEATIDSPTNFALEQNYPNPFNPVTTIKYSIPNVGTGFSLSVLKVYDILGNEVATLVNEPQPAGNYEVKFDARNAEHGPSMASGVYLYKLQVGSFVQTKKFVLMK
ncbi:MAG: leucine-rich repeat protein [Melioribacteraceae bacterium]|nr:leucine-rich repeat protein [Melioribacteraceae bacterium]